MPESFPRYFNPQDLGKSLKEVATDVIRTSEQDVVSRWFHSAKDADLFIWLDAKKNIIKQQLSYYGQVVEWNVVEGVKTGHIIVDEGRDQSQSSEFLRFDSKPQMASIDQALKLLECVTALQDFERKVLMDNLQRVSASQNMPAEEFIARYGDYLRRPDTVVSVTPWQRLWDMAKWIRAFLANL